MIDRFRVQSLVIDVAKKLLTANLHAGDEGDAAGDASGRSDPFAGAEVIDVAPVFSQMGVLARPVIARTLRALGLRDGDDVLVLKLWDRARTPTDVEEGETRVYSVANIARMIRLLSGSIVVEAPTIKLGATATKKVARETDTVRVTIPAGTTFSGTVGMTPTTFTTTTPVTCDGTITSGSAKVLADD